jgi:hypothetical protein
MRGRSFLATAAVLSLLTLGGGAGTAAAPFPNQRAKRPQSLVLQHHGIVSQLDAYTGRITTKRGLCVLINPNAETTYRLDDQHKAKHFLGKDVIVIGSRDIIKNTIHVSEIRFNKSS